MKLSIIIILNAVMAHTKVQVSKCINECWYISSQFAT